MIIFVNILAPAYYVLNAFFFACMKLYLSYASWCVANDVKHLSLKKNRQLMMQRIDTH